MANVKSAVPADGPWSDIIDSLSRVVGFDLLVDIPQWGCSSVELIRWQLSKNDKKQMRKATSMRSKTFEQIFFPFYFQLKML